MPCKKFVQVTSEVRDGEPHSTSVTAPTQPLFTATHTQKHGSLRPHKSKLSDAVGAHGGDHSLQRQPAQAADGCQVPTARNTSTQAILSSSSSSSLSTFVVREVLQSTVTVVGVFFKRVCSGHTAAPATPLGPLRSYLCCHPGKNPVVPSYRYVPEACQSPQSRLPPGSTASAQGDVVAQHVAPARRGSRFDLCSPLPYTSKTFNMTGMGSPRVFRSKTSLRWQSAATMAMGGPGPHEALHCNLKKGTGKRANTPNTCDPAQILGDDDAAPASSSAPLAPHGGWP